MLPESVEVDARDVKLVVGIKDGISHQRSISKHWGLSTILIEGHQKPVFECSATTETDTRVKTP